jgi:hypothetical protein
MSEQIETYGQRPGLSEQSKQIKRVHGRIAPAVMQFMRDKGVGAHFHADELRNYVEIRHGIAPDSAGRILRLLRREGRVDYEIIQRSFSLYRITKIS